MELSSISLWARREECKGLFHLHMTGAPHRLGALRIIQHRCGARERERERCGREQECGGAQRESERKKGGVRMGECDKACSSKTEEERKLDRLRMFPPSSRKRVKLCYQEYGQYSSFNARRQTDFHFFTCTRGSLWRRGLSASKALTSWHSTQN